MPVELVRGRARLVLRDAHDLRPDRRRALGELAREPAQRRRRRDVRGAQVGGNESSTRRPAAGPSPSRRRTRLERVQRLRCEGEESVVAVHDQRPPHRALRVERRRRPLFRPRVQPSHPVGRPRGGKRPECDHKLTADENLARGPRFRQPERRPCPRGTLVSWRRGATPEIPARRVHDVVPHPRSRPRPDLRDAGIEHEIWALAGARRSGRPRRISWRYSTKYQGHSAARTS